MRAFISLRWLRWWLPLLLFTLPVSAQAPGGIVPFRLNLGVEAAQQPQDVDVAIKILFTITLLSLAPSIVLLMTSFTRIVIVLSFVRSALSLQGTPANQISSACRCS
jgi:flagellar biosynthetic protein FliP